MLKQLQELLKGTRINWLLFFLPLSWFLLYFSQKELWIFIAASLAIIPLAGIMGQATDELTKITSQGVGAFLNATFGNATELIIALLALRRGLYQVVKASITGSILGNILVVLGLAMVFGGWRRQKQIFDRTTAGANSAMLLLALVALVVPAVFDLALFGRLKETGRAVESLSLLVSVILILTYLFSLIFSFRTHRIPALFLEEEPRWSFSFAIGILSAATGLIALESEILVRAIEVAAKSLGITEFFMGIIIIALIGNAAEHATAVQMGAKDKMDAALGIAVGSSIQIALFVAPVLVFVSYLLGQPMSLVFNAFEIASVALAVAIVSLVSLDGESNWFEGLQLIAVYLILAIAFYFVP